VIFLASILGALTANLYSEPLNRLLRSRWQRARGNIASALPVETAS
jgi:hypothetical protein